MYLIAHSEVLCLDLFVTLFLMISATLLWMSDLWTWLVLSIFAFASLVFLLEATHWVSPEKPVRAYCYDYDCPA